MSRNIVLNIYNNNDGFTITSNGNEYSMTFVPSPEDKSQIECVGDFIFKNGNEEDTIISNALCGAPVTFSDPLFYFKRQFSISMKNTLPAFESYTAGDILNIKFESKADISITVPEDSHYTYFPGTNSCYIFKDEDIEGNMEDTGIGDMVNAIYSSKSGRYKLMVDYTCNETFLLDRMDNVISSTKFGNGIYDINVATYKDYGKINYIHTGKDIICDIKKDYENSDLFCIRVDMLNEDDEVDKIIVIYPIPYLVTLDDLHVFDEETKLYCSLEYNKTETPWGEEELQLTVQSYCILDAEGEKNLYREWMEVLEKLSAEDSDNL